MVDQQRVFLLKWCIFRRSCLKIFFVNFYFRLQSPKLPLKDISHSSLNIRLFWPPWIILISCFFHGVWWCFECFKREAPISIKNLPPQFYLPAFYSGETVKLAATVIKQLCKILHDLKKNLHDLKKIAWSKMQRRGRYRLYKCFSSLLSRFTIKKNPFRLWRNLFEHVYQILAAQSVKKMVTQSVKSNL